MGAQMVVNRETYEEKVELLWMEALAETEGTLGIEKRDAPVFWRMCRDEFRRRMHASPDWFELERVVYGDEMIGRQLRPWFDRLKRTRLDDGNDGGGDKYIVPQGQRATAPPPSTVSEDVEAKSCVSNDQLASASSSSDATTTWEPKAPEKSPPRPVSDRRREIERRIWGGFPIDDHGQVINVRDVAVHRLKRLEPYFARAAIKGAIQHNIVALVRQEVERSTYVPPHSLVRDIVSVEAGDRIVADARQRAEGFLFMLPKGMRVPVALHDG
jgi:hypothetical protein